MTSEKPKFTVNLTEGAQSSLVSQAFLHLVDDQRAFHIERNLRPALGIYNISTSRVCAKISQFCWALEQRITSNRGIDTRNDSGILSDELVDYIELALYAAAEHVDDLKLIAENFYRNDQLRNRCSAFRDFSKAIKDHKRFISTFANLIKHSQSRVRLFTLDYEHSGIGGRLYGYFVEGVHKGTVCPHPIFHNDQKNILSITSLAWEIICFLLNCSVSLKKFLEHQPLLHGPASVKAPHFANAVISASRLPLYTFDDDHPFSKVTLQMIWDAPAWERASSELYGSIRNPWSKSQNMQFGKNALAYVGDGVSRSFKIVGPSRVGIQHWS